MVAAALVCSLYLGQTPKSIPYQWKNVEIVGGGFVTGIITHPYAKDVVYARTDIGGAYRWNPKTHRWVPLEDFITRSDWNLYGTESIALDPNDPNRIYIAAGTYTNEWGGNGAILRSKDRGETWERINLPFKNGGNENGRSIGERLVVHPNRPNILYFGTRNNGLQRSKDFGSTWEQVLNFPITGPTNGIGIGWIQFTSDNFAGAGSRQTIYVGTTGLDENLWKSDDEGKTWATVPGQPKKLWPHHCKVDLDDMYLAYCNGPGPNGVTDGAVYRLNLESGKFTNITPEEPGPGNTFGYGGVTFDSKHPNTVMVSTLDRWAKHDTVFRSTNGGITWMNLSQVSKRDSTKAKYLDWNRKEPEFGHWIGDVEIDPFDSNRAWYVTGATIWGTDNLRDADKGKTVNWVPRAEGLEETAVLDLVSPPEGAHVISALGDIAGFAHFDLEHSPPGGMWTNPLWNTTLDIDYAGKAPLTVIRIGRNQGAVSHDGGHSWKPFSGKLEGVRNFDSAAISADAHTVVIQPQGSTAQWSDDEGATWHVASGEQTSGRIIGDRVDPKTFYVHDGKTGKILRSSDGGRTFQKFVQGAVSEKGRIYPVVGHEGDIWIPLNRGALHVTQKGIFNAGISDGIFVEQIAFGKAAPGKSYPTAFIIGKIKGVEGIYRSLDECRTWERINDAKTGFGSGEVIEGDPRIFGRVYIGTNGRGVLYGDIKK